MDVEKQAIGRSRYHTMETWAKLMVGRINELFFKDLFHPKIRNSKED